MWNSIEANKKGKKMSNVAEKKINIGGHKLITVHFYHPKRFASLSNDTGKTRCGSMQLGSNVVNQ